MQSSDKIKLSDLVGRFLLPNPERHPRGGAGRRCKKNRADEEIDPYAAVCPL